MPDAPTWEFIADAARKMTDRANDINGICLRGKAGWGENMALPDRHVQLLRRALVRRELEAAVRPAGMEEDARLLRQADEGRRPAGRFVQRLQREPGAVPAGQVRHVDRRHGRRFLRHRSRRTPRSPTRSATRWRPTTASASAATGCGPGRSPFRPARRRRKRRRSSSPGRPARAISSSSPSKEGWANVPPGTRTSLYNNPEYQKAAPFAKMTLDCDQLRPIRPSRPSSRCLMSACQFVAIPEFQGLGTTVGQLFSAALAGQMTVDDALQQAQDADDARDDQRRLHQVGILPVPPAVRFRTRRRAAAFEPRSTARSRRRSTAGVTAMATWQTRTLARFMMAPAVHPAASSG